MPNNMRHGRSVRLWLPVLVWMAVIFAASSVPGRRVPVLFRYQDIFSHIGVYGILGFLYARALKYSLPFGFPALAAITAVLCVFYGISDEWHQSFVPGRSVSAFDVMYDGIGGLIGAFTASTRDKGVRKNG